MLTPILATSDPYQATPEARRHKGAGVEERACHAVLVGCRFLIAAEDA
jgi:hypothetical protein